MCSFLKSVILSILFLENFIFIMYVLFPQESQLFMTFIGTYRFLIEPSYTSIYSFQEIQLYQVFSQNLSSVWFLFVLSKLYIYSFKTNPSSIMTGFYENFAMPGFYRNLAIYSFHWNPIYILIGFSEKLSMPGL